MTVNKALGAIRGKIDQINGCVARLSLLGLGHGCAQWIQVCRPFGNGKVGVAITPEQRINFVTTHLTGFAPKVRIGARITGIKRHNVWFVTVADGNFYLQCRVSRQIEGPEQSLHEHMVGMFVGFLDKDNLLTVGMQGPFAS
ncbi:MAG: hypothetical protein NT075_23825 [Chloroflexi bacterium]|nr:hypothetical protein [Chloroflexota bacterium]